MTKKEQEKHLKEILDDFDNAMLITLASNLRPHARPMRIADVNDNDQLWFVTSGQSGKIDEIEANPVVGITMQGDGKYLSLGGKATIINHSEKIDDLWDESWKIWFPEGKSDPSITLLRVDLDHGEYWDMSGTNRFRFVYEAGKAWIKGQELNYQDEDMNAKVNL